MTKEEGRQLGRKLSHVLGDPHVFTSNYRGDKLEDFTQFSYGSFERANKFTKPEDAHYYVPGLLSGSDYCGSSVEASNFRCFMEDFKNQLGVSMWELFGGYGTYGIAIDIEKATPEMIETLEALDSYPLISEDDLTELELEREEEAWSNYIRSDFKSALKKRFANTGDDEEDERIETRIDNFSADELLEIFRYWQDKANVYYEHEEGGSVYIDIERIVTTMTSLDLPNPNQQEMPL